MSRGIPFYKFLNESDLVIYPPTAHYNTLWPETALPVEVKQEIEDHFYNRFTCHAYPQYWLRRFHSLVRREADKWIKLIESESALRPDDAIYNYDMVEESEYSGQSSNRGTSSSTSKTTTDNTGYTSDTPESSVDDIEHYMSAAEKANAVANGEGTGESESSGEGSGRSRLTRKGNIGVMTSAQIIGGYREASRWCAYDEVIFPELEDLFWGVWEEEGYGYVWGEE